MTRERSKLFIYLVPLGVLLALVGAFFWGSRHPHFPPVSSSTTADESESFGAPDAEVWISKEKLFIWNHEPAAALSELPARIEKFKQKRPPGRVSISSEALTRFDDIVYALNELKKGGFHSVLVVTKPKPEPAPDRY